ncbi:style cell-cycle inhibitor 1-B [Nymphaea colorata]|nr:style cell-cycle inhibitor 1-B [Nymphaea colorata]XP_049936550.1 style cell-cycle inhibitor 1-B [Nymphaea colorata]
MGRNDGDSDRRKRLKRRSHPSDEEDGEKKRHRSRDKQTKRNEKDGKKRRHKSSRRSSRDDDKKMKRVKRKEQKSSFEEISLGDYYSKNNEFSSWLKEEKGVFFSDLSSEEAHKLFERFVKDWNNQNLQSHYYEGIACAPRTSHNWKIKHDKVSDG